MFKNFYFMFFLIPTIYFGQQIKFKSDLQIEYNFSYSGDSTKINEKQSELMTLYIHENSSVYESNVRMYIDSIENNYSGQILDMSTFPKRKVTTTIYKNRREDLYTFIDDFLNFNVKYEYKPDFDWTLLKDHKKIGGYKCYLARTLFGGRTYYAWYTPEIPIFDGPYKFQGLPGLILDVYDSENYFSFKMTRISKNEITLKRNFTNFAVVDKNKYYSKKNNFLQSKYSKLNIVYNPLEKAEK